MIDPVYTKSWSDNSLSTVASSIVGPSKKEREHTTASQMPDLLNILEQ